MVSADRWGNKSLATRFPTARGSALSPVTNPLRHRNCSEEIAVTTTEKLDSSASSPFIVPSAEQPLKGAPPVVSRTARTKECCSYPIEPNMTTTALVAMDLHLLLVRTILAWKGCAVYLKRTYSHHEQN